MAEQCGFFGTGGDSRYYSQYYWLKFIRDFRLDGYVEDADNELAVSAHSPPGMSVDVGTGEAWVQGNWYKNDATLNPTISTADPSYGRIDRIIVRNYIAGQRKCQVMVLAGTPAGTPVGTTLTRTTDIWDICLAEVAVAAGATQIVTGNITDTRTNTSLCGIASPNLVRLADVIPGDQIDMTTHKIGGVDYPDADTDGVTVEYFNAAALTILPGLVYAYAGSGEIPSGWLECNEQAVSRITYAALFAIIGTTFGAGDGSSTFNLPNKKGKSIAGYDAAQSEFNATGKSGGEKTHVLITAEMPAHVHSGCNIWAPANGQVGSYGNYGGGNNPANTSSVGGGLAHQNVPLYFVLRYMIKV